MYLTVFPWHAAFYCHVVTPSDSEIWERTKQKFVEFGQNIRLLSCFASRVSGIYIKCQHEDKYLTFCTDILKTRKLFVVLILTLLYFSLNDIWEMFIKQDRDRARVIQIPKLKHQSNMPRSYTTVLPHVINIRSLPFIITAELFL